VQNSEQQQGLLVKIDCGDSVTQLLGTDLGDGTRLQSYDRSIP
jgi:hypothetical protein